MQTLRVCNKLTAAIQSVLLTLTLIVLNSHQQQLQGATKKAVFSLNQGFSHKANHARHEVPDFFNYEELRQDWPSQKIGLLMLVADGDGVVQS
mmetsp:Transcript_7006/g.19633  ORF Transcript_7006/g.19633 Transcript_7006/m.19633 type:complete len:93 (-) Transcript_7006:601-879(-)